MNYLQKKLFFICLIITLFSRGNELYTSAQTMMNDLNSGDSAKFFNHFEPGVVLHHLDVDGLQSISLEDFARVLPKFKNKEYHEEVLGIYVTELPTGLCYADIEFSFYINEELAFSGVDHSLWIKKADGTYRITELYTGALQPKFSNAQGEGQLESQLNALLDKWHRDVAEIKFGEYFAFMSEDFIFLGTDPSERWTKAEFETFCKPFFDKKSTWDFTPNWRNWYLSHDGQTAWFEESLNTWMEECRGSGVLKQVNGEWKIAHYNLTVLIENEKVDKFIKLRKK